MFHEWMTTYEPEWLAAILLVETLAGFGSLYILIKEFKYDEQKDLEKKQKRTKTTKKTSTKAGETVVEESVETSEPVQDTITKGEMK
jgi:mannitol-specific phosphotransferase system IIBC component